MLFCITFLVTSLTTEASSNTPDVSYDFTQTVNLRFANGHYIPDIYYIEYASSSPYKYWGNVKESGESFNVDLNLLYFFSLIINSILST